VAGRSAGIEGEEVDLDRLAASARRWRSALLAKIRKAEVEVTQIAAARGAATE
jgi:hypothetical protein